jgi:hypothetical protein
MAAAMRSMKADVIDGKIESKLYDQFTETFRCLLTGEWRRLPRIEKPLDHRESRGALSLRVIGTVLIVALPLGIASASAFHSGEQEKKQKQNGSQQSSLSTSKPEDDNKDDNNFFARIEKSLRESESELQVIAGIIGSAVLLMSRLDDITARVARQST